VDPWNLSAVRAAANRERGAALHELLVRFKNWLHRA
jgi:hypothetical protein